MALNIPKKESGDEFTASEFNQVVAEINKKQDSSVGKGLSSNDYTNEDKAIVEGLAEFDPGVVDSLINGKADSTNVYDKQEVDALIEDARISLNLTDEQLAGLNVNLTPITNELDYLNPFPMNGKKMLVLGDSLSSAGGGSMESPAVGSWCQYVKNLLALSSSSRVIAQGGATCTDKNTTVIKTDKADWGGDNNVLSNQVYSVINHYKTNQGTASEFVPDVIMIMVGTNNSHTTYPDPMWNTIAGNWASCMYTQFVDTDFDLYDLTNATQLQKYNALREVRKKFYSAYKWAIEALLHWFPNASIYVLSPMANSGGRGQNIYEFTLPACRKVADFLSCGWIDVYSRSGLSYYSNNRKNNGWSDQWYTFDGTHPNFNPGMELIGRYVAKELLNQYFVKPQLVATKVPMNPSEDVFYSVSIVNANADTTFGTTDPVGSQQVIKGGALTVNITPTSGHYIYSVKVNGVEQGSISSYTFANVQSNQEIIVEFAVGQSPVETFTVTAQSNNTNFGTVAPTTQTVQKGAIATITATAKSGYVIDNWSGATGTGADTASGVATLSNVQANKAITCNFKQAAVQPTNKTALSFPWGYSEVGEENGVTKVYIKNIADDNTTPIGKLNFNGRGVTNYVNTVGAVTGDNSGIYPDKFLERGVVFTAGLDKPKQGEVTISSIVDGTYKIGILTNMSSTCNWAANIAEPSMVSIDVNGTVKNPVKITDNTDTLTVFDNVMVSDGVLRIAFTITGANRRCMFNMLVVEKIA